ncbi:MAG: alpha/beta fold hydrolase [Desulfosarcina sp.]|nr:alpha/beta fold hydrolase [Desulfosarcina sp.]MBC2744323.1 alpha/beta fold hydrolase [Desulfosarcina sp.]MBC2767232.1 alpha/beta hydrolase [Desulfosarcina sp.]
MSVYAHNTIPDRLEHLDTYLSESESRVSGIRENCEKTIIWNDGKTEQRDLAIVYIHGFSASRMETWPLCNRLAEDMGANLFYTRLSGHGQDGYAMATATVTDWLNDGMEAMAIGRRLGKKIILVGSSTGGTLATWLAAQPSVSPQIHSLILFSPNFFPKNPLAAATLWPPGLRLFERLFGSWRCFTVSNAMQARYWTVRYPLKAIATMMQLVHLSWRIDLNDAGMPVLMMVNPWDRVINITLAITRFLNFPSPQKRLVLFRGNKDLGRHVLAGNILAPESTEKAMAIIQAYLRDQSSAPPLR